MISWWTHNDIFNIVCSLLDRCCQYSFAHGSYAQMKSRTQQIIPKPSPQAQDKNLCHHDIIKHGRASCGECIRHDFSSQRIGTGDRYSQLKLAAAKVGIHHCNMWWFSQGLPPSPLWLMQAQQVFILHCARFRRRTFPPSTDRNIWKNHAVLRDPQHL